MSEALFSQLLATTTGLLLVTAVLQVWRQSLGASIRVLAVQGAALAGLVAVLGINHGDVEVLIVAVLVLGMKAVAIPWTLSRTAAATGAVREEAPLVNPTAGLLAATALTVLACAEHGAQLFIQLVVPVKCYLLGSSTLLDFMAPLHDGLTQHNVAKVQHMQQIARIANSLSY